MNIPEGIFKGYDIRGIFPDQLNEENVKVIAEAIYAFFLSKLPEKKSLSIVVGRDMRESSPVLFTAVKETLVKLGAEVIEPGIVSTPAFYFLVTHSKYDAGIQITASHNPKEYNGLKFVVNSPQGLIKIGKSTGMDDIKKMSLDGVRVNSSSGQGKVTKIENVTQLEYENAFEVAGQPKIKPFKVVADPANAMGATYIEELFKHIPGELIKMNFELDGTFPAHQADPLQFELLKDLQDRVVAEGADLGLAPDGDGDRIMFIDEKGGVVLPSVITAIIAKELLRNNQGEKIIFDVRYTLTPKKIVDQNGGESLISKVGHAFITEDMQKSGAIFAGESSGHYYFRATGGAESAIIAILIVLSVLTRENKPFSEVAKEYKMSQESGEINFKVKNAKEIIEVLKGKYSEGELNELDGIAVDFPDWRFSVRTSNTEPLLRLNVEEELVGAKGRHKQLVDLINKHATPED